jgi:esterase/lipase
MKRLLAIAFIGGAFSLTPILSASACRWQRHIRWGARTMELSRSEAAMVMGMGTGGAITVVAAITTVGAAVVTMAGTEAITTVGGIITAIGGDVLNQWRGRI